MEEGTQFVKASYVFGDCYAPQETRPGAAVHPRTAPVAQASRPMPTRIWHQDSFGAALNFPPEGHSTIVQRFKRLSLPTSEKGRY